MVNPAIVPFDRLADRADEAVEVSPEDGAIVPEIITEAETTVLIVITSMLVRFSAMPVSKAAMIASMLIKT